MNNAHKDNQGITPPHLQSMGATPAAHKDTDDHIDEDVDVIFNDFEPYRNPNNFGSMTSYNITKIRLDEAREKVKKLIAQEVEAAHKQGQVDGLSMKIDDYLNENPLQAPQLIGAMIYLAFMENTNATEANIKLSNFSKKGEVKGNLSVKATLTNPTKESEEV